MSVDPLSSSRKHARTQETEEAPHATSTGTTTHSDNAWMVESSGCARSRETMHEGRRRPRERPSPKKRVKSDHHAIAAHIPRLRRVSSRLQTTLGPETMRFDAELREDCRDMLLHMKPGEILKVTAAVMRSRVERGVSRQLVDTLEKHLGARLLHQLQEPAATHSKREDCNARSAVCNGNIAAAAASARLRLLRSSDEDATTTEEGSGQAHKDVFAGQQQHMQAAAAMAVVQSPQPVSVAAAGSVQAALVPRMKAWARQAGDELERELHHFFQYVQQQEEEAEVIKAGASGKYPVVFSHELHFSGHLRDRLWRVLLQSSREDLVHFRTALSALQVADSTPLPPQLIARAAANDEAPRFLSVTEVVDGFATCKNVGADPSQQRVAEETRTNCSRWTELPADIMASILMFLPLRTALVATAVVCRSWFRATMDSRTWGALRSITLAALPGDPSQVRVLFSKLALTLESLTLVGGVSRVAGSFSSDSSAGMVDITFLASCMASNRRYAPTLSSSVGQEAHVGQHALSRSQAGVLCVIPPVNEASSMNLVDNFIWPPVVMLALKSLTLRACQGVNADSLDVLLQCFPALERLDVGECPGVTDEALYISSRRCSKVHELKIDGCAAVGRSVSVRERNSTGGGQGNSFALALSAFENLMNLDLGSCRGVTDDVIRCLPVLHRLCLQDCWNLRSPAVEYISNKCGSQLSVLDLSRCYNILRDDSLERLFRCCRGLCELKLNGCAVSDTMIIEPLRNLSRAHVEYTVAGRGIQDTQHELVGSIRVPSHVASLVSNPSTDTSALSARHAMLPAQVVSVPSVHMLPPPLVALRRLELASGACTDAGLAAVVDTCVSLEYLDISDCGSLILPQTLSRVLCHLHLQYLNVSQCGELCTDAALQCMSASVMAVSSPEASVCACRTTLQTIIMDGCYRITCLGVAFALHCPALTKLSVRGCMSVGQGPIGRILTPHLNRLLSLELFGCGLGDISVLDCQKHSDCSITSAVTMESRRGGGHGAVGRCMHELGLGGSMRLSSAGAASMLSLCGSPALRKLSMYACTTAVTDELLVQVSTLCPFLEDLDLTQCSSITDAGVRALFQKSRGYNEYFVRLCLDDCVRLSDGAVKILCENAAALNRLSVARCNITDASCRMLVEARTRSVRRIPLAHFIVSLCRSVTRAAKEELRLKRVTVVD